MLRPFSLLIMLFTNISVYADPLPSPLPDTLYFSPSWCPREEELVELSKHLELTMNGCCILKATPLPETISHPEVLSSWAGRIYERNSNLSAPCVGLTAEEARLKEEQARLDEERRRFEAPNILKSMPKNEFCAAYGKGIREGEVEGIGALSDIMKLLKKELTRRKIKLDDSLVRKGHIKLGISECQLYASWGLPEDQNQSVGRWGVHTQHVYGLGNYVYTENGRVTSWQD